MIKTFTQTVTLLIAIIGLSNVSFAQLTDLIISEYSEGSTYNKYIELYNGTEADINLSDYEIWINRSAGKWNQAAIIPSGRIVRGGTYLIAHGNAAGTIKDAADQIVPNSPAIGFTGNDAIGLAKKNTTGVFELIDAVGESGDNPGDGWDVAGINDATKNHTLIRKETACLPNTNWAASAGTSTEDSEWIVMHKDYWPNIGTHVSTCGTVVTPLLSVNDVNGVNALSVYPNPNATGNVNFNKVISFTVYTITGKAIITKSNVNRLDVSNLQNGVYIIQTTNAEVLKLIIE